MDRLQADVDALSQIGRAADHGLHRIAFSGAYRQACEWLAERASAAGLGVRSDEAGNVIVRLDGASDEPLVMTGSHLDTVPGGGHLDGALGVVAGLEALRCLREVNRTPKRALECVAFADEEGRFGGMLGSQALAGVLSPQSLLEARDLQGVALADALAQFGLEPLGVLKAARPTGSLHAFVELHIEQGPVLDRAGVDVGVVEGIVGLLRWNARLVGISNHAGTTPMDARRDAFQGLAEAALAIPEVVLESGGPRAVATIGRVELQPGAANVIPGRVDFSLEMRHIDPELLHRMASDLRELFSAVARRRDLMFEFELSSQLAPVRCAPSVRDVIATSADRLGHRSLALASGAAHDTQTMAHLCDVGMVFVPSREGRSHSAAEWTSWSSIQAGADVLLNTLHTLAFSS
jgi:N-carbamoyl-L-amino-acid hydrolase